MHQRWHEDDLAGRLIKRMVEDEEADQWTVLNLPAIAEEWAERVEGDEVIQACHQGWWKSVDALGRAAGEALWPERFGLEKLLSIRANLGGYEWDALYQQRPRPIEGAIIKAYDIIQVRRAEAPEDHELKIVRYWDLAVSGGERGHYIVGAKLARARDGRVYIFHIARLKGPWADARPKMIDVMLRDGVNVEQGIEVAGQQSGYHQELQRDPKLVGIAVTAVNPKEVGSKEVRANVWASRIPDGLIYLIRDGGWNVDAFLAEAVAFPMGAEDDQVDGVSGGVQMLGGWMGSFSDVPQDDGGASRWILEGDKQPVAEGVRWPL